MSVWTVMLLAAALTHQLHALDSKELEDSELLNYVVALIRDELYCYGTLISPNWVVTAANCLDATSVQYGKLSIPWHESTSRRKILYVERPRSVKSLEPDLGLVFISSVPLSTFGQLSAVDYKALSGHAIKYSFFIILGNLKLNEGIVISCNVEKSGFSSEMCIAPSCSHQDQSVMRLAPGSPLFHDGKLVGVHARKSDLQYHLGDTKELALVYTPISPYLSWINEVMSSKEFEKFY